MDLNASRGVYALCFRPIGGSVDSPNRYAYRYLHIEVEDLKVAARTEELPASISEMLDREL